MPNSSERIILHEFVLVIVTFGHRSDIFWATIRSKLFRISLPFEWAIKPGWGTKIFTGGRRRCKMLS